MKGALSSRIEVKPSTWALWFGPAVIFAAGLLALALYYRRRRRQPSAAAEPLNADEQRRLDRLLEEAKE